jgi:hypothetical protein
MLAIGIQYHQSFMEPWREIGFESPNAGARFVQELIERGVLLHN